MRDDCHASRSGTIEVGESTAAIVATRMMSGASACQSKTGLAIVTARAASTSPASGHLITFAIALVTCVTAASVDVEHDVGEDAERDDEREDRDPRGPLEARDVVDVRVSNSAFGTPNATFWNIHSR